MSNVKVIEVLGPGCPRCKATFEVVKKVVEEAGLACEVIKNESIDRMVALGLMATPGVAVDGKVVIFGRVPKADEVRRALGLV
ncbi:MAG: MTH895/ArsE family thioredoxin-like protein [Thermoanaerobaculum sp.]